MTKDVIHSLQLSTRNLLVYVVLMLFLVCFLLVTLGFRRAFRGILFGKSHFILGLLIYTSTGRKFALVEGLSHDLACAGSNYHVHFAWQVWHGQYSPGFKFDKLKSFSRVEIDQDPVD